MHYITIPRQTIRDPVLVITNHDTERDPVEAAAPIIIVARGVTPGGIDLVQFVEHLVARQFIGRPSLICVPVAVCATRCTWKR